MSEVAASANPIELTADIVAAYASNNSVPAAELPSLINAVFLALTQAVAGQTEVKVERKEPAVPVKKSVTPDFIICLEDGKKFKSLKRHLRTTYDLTPEQYRAKWNLPADYPMVAPNYAKARSELAKTMGLGQQRKRALAGKVAAPAAPAKPKRAAAKAAAPSAQVAAPAKGRRAKAA